MMSEALADTPVSSFSDATDDIVQGDSISVPSVSGLSVQEAERKLRNADLEPVVSGDQVYASYAQAGTVAYSYPGTGSAVYPGQRVVLYISAGSPPAPEQPEPDDQTTLGPDPGNGNGNGNGRRNGRGNGEGGD
jgi:beta-lactam-binding protein with PASTA domain